MAAAPPQQFCVRWNSYHSNLQTWFPRLLVSEQFADVTLACEARQLRCHKIVLSACSAYLERLLAANPCTHPIVLMRDMRFSEMQALVDFMYKGEVNVTQEELPSLLKSAEALQIRGLCSGETAGLLAESPSSPSPPAPPAALPAPRPLLKELSPPAHTNGAPVHQKLCPPPAGAGGGGKQADDVSVKEETVEEDGLYYGELDADHMDYHEEEEAGKVGAALAQTSARDPIRVKPESELFFQTKLQNLAKANSDYLSKLSKMSALQIRREFSKYGLEAGAQPEPAAQPDAADDDYYKSWLEQNGELEVSLLRANQPKRTRAPAAHRSEVELIPKGKGDAQARRRGRPPIFKDRRADIGEAVLKSDLDQFLEGKEVSSSGLSRKDLERVMMGKFNPNRRYSNEAMWAALMDVKKGGSIYRAAQTHKVPRKSLRNWMKRCHIKSSFPMPQQLKQFVENSKRQKEFVATAAPDSFGKHFLASAGSSDGSGPDDAPAPE